MVIAKPLNTPTTSELTKAHDFLYEADMLVTDVDRFSSTAMISRRPPGSRTFRVALPMSFMS